MSELDIVKNILKSSIQTLGSVNLPVAMIEPIGVPIYNVRGQLIEGLKLLEKEQPSDQTNESENLDESGNQ